MTVSQLFQLAGGSVSGRDHRRGVPRNNQDAFEIFKEGDIVVACASDGCGSGKHSEYGAKRAVRRVPRLIIDHLRKGGRLDANGLRRISDNFAAELRLEALAMSDSLSWIVNNYFLFTILFVVITPTTTMFIYFGDGIVVVNGEVIVLKPLADNSPQYIGYLLTGSTLMDEYPEEFEFRVARELPTVELESFLIGTDGAVELIDRADDCLPGMNEKLGPLEQFWTDDHYFGSEHAVEMRLNLVVRDRYKATPSGRQALQGGLIGDDVTLIAGRRRLEMG